MGFNHMLVDLWDTGQRWGSCIYGSIISLDFEKPFNRLCHDAWICALREHGASKTSVSVVHSFLRDRTMSARIVSTLSAPKQVNGGSPQGSILGNLLFTVTTDKLADSIEYDRGYPNASMNENDSDSHES